MKACTEVGRGGGIFCVLVASDLSHEKGRSWMNMSPNTLVSSWFIAGLMSIITTD